MTYTINYVDLSLVGHICGTDRSDGYLVDTDTVSTIALVYQSMRRVLHKKLGLHTYDGLGEIAVYIQQSEWDAQRLAAMHWQQNADTLELYGLDFDAWYEEYLTDDEREHSPAFTFSWRSYKPRKTRKSYYGRGLPQCSDSTPLYNILRTAIGDGCLYQYSQQSGINNSTLYRLIDNARTNSNARLRSSTIEKIVAASDGRVTYADFADHIMPYG